MGRQISALHVESDGSTLKERFGAINKKTWGKKTSELDLFGYMGIGPSVFAAFCLRSVLMLLALTVIAYLFRNLASVVG